MVTALEPLIHFVINNCVQEMKKKNCHCLYHTSARVGLMVTHMQLAYNLLPPVQRCSARLGIHVLLQVAGSYSGKHHKPPTHLQLYCIFKSAESS